MLIDVNLRPNLIHKGIVSKNTNGVWNVVCVDPNEINRNGAQMAGEICSMLGFSGYSFFNVTSLFRDSSKVLRSSETLRKPFSKHLHTHYDHTLRHLRKRHNDPNEFWSDMPSDLRDGILFSEMVGTPQSCARFYIECVPHPVFPVVIPLPDGIRPNHSNPSLPMPSHPKPTDASHAPPQSQPSPPSQGPPQVPAQSQPSLPTKVPSDMPPTPVPVQTPPQPSPIPLPPTQSPPQSQPKPQPQPPSLRPPSSEHKNDEHFPWSASIFIEGRLACNGILFDQIWIGVEASCVTAIKYDFRMETHPHKKLIIVLLQLAIRSHLCGARHFEQLYQYSKSVRTNRSS